MCSWCWAFRPTWLAIISQLSDQVDVVGVLGGLAPDTTQPMTKEMQIKLRNIWKTIQQQVPGTKFNFKFWQVCKPRRSTYAACRAVISAGNQSPEFQQSMILAIQTAYYLRALNPSDDTTLTDLAVELEMDKERFVVDLNSHQTQQKLKRQMVFSRTLGVSGYPSLVLEHDNRLTKIPLDYNDPGVVLNALKGISVN